MSITYRKPGEDEAEAFAALHVQCWRESYVHYLPPQLMASFSVEKRLPMWQARLGDNKLFVLGAYAEDVPVGFIMCGAADQKYITDQDGHVGALYVAAAHHRRGIGRELMARGAMNWINAGGRSLTIGVLAKNKPARAFYESLGAEFVQNSTFLWDEFALPDCLYILRDLAKIAKV